jgi:hypothetical protein
MVGDLYTKFDVGLGNPLRDCTLEPTPSPANILVSCSGPNGLSGFVSLGISEPNARLATILVDEKIDSGVWPGAGATSVWMKSSPLKSKGSSVALAKAYAKQSPKLSLAGCPLPLPKSRYAARAMRARSKVTGSTRSSLL